MEHRINPAEPFPNLQSILDSLDVRTAATISLSDVTTAHEFNMADLREHTVQKMISTYGIGSVEIRTANCHLGSTSESNDDFKPHPSVPLCTQQFYLASPVHTARSTWFHGDPCSAAVGTPCRDRSDMSSSHASIATTHKPCSSYSISYSYCKSCMSSFDGVSSLCTQCQNHLQ